MRATLPWGNLTTTRGYEHHQPAYVIGPKPRAEPVRHDCDDVAPTAFAYNDIGCIYQLEITTGISPTAYGPANVVTRERMGECLAQLTRALAVGHTIWPDGLTAKSPLFYVYRPGVTPVAAGPVMPRSPSNLAPGPANG